MSKLSKKEVILISVLVVLFVSVITVTIINILYKPNNDTNKEKENEQEVNISEKINLINETNKIFNNIDLEDKTKYENSLGFTCYKYTGNDMKNIINNLNTLYIKPFYENSFFNITIDNNGEEKLYLCKQENCEISLINEYKIISEVEDKKTIKIHDTETAIIKRNNEWKFIFPIVLCEN